jgi:hypothetical protein
VCAIETKKITNKSISGISKIDKDGHPRNTQH